MKKPKNEHDHAAYTVKLAKTTHILSLPDEVLEHILQEVLKDGDKNFILCSVCTRFNNIMTRESFRRKAHHTWLDSVFNWSTSTRTFKEEYYRMYEVKKCFECNIQYKEMCGFVGNGQLGESYKFYSSLTYPGFCSNECIPDHS